MVSEELFSMRLRTLRKQCRLTQQQVADHLSLHRTTYTKYETGVVAPDREALVRLSELFGVSVDYLVGRDAEVMAVADCAKAGVAVVGMGSKLFPKEVIQAQEWDKIAEKCREALAIIAQVR